MISGQEMSLPVISQQGAITVFMPVVVGEYDVAGTPWVKLKQRVTLEDGREAEFGGQCPRVNVMIYER